MAKVHPNTENRMASATGVRPTRVRYLVLMLLCSLACLTYLDRICIMRVQGDIERDLQLDRLSARDEQTLAAKGLANDIDARAKLAQDRATERMSWVFSAFVLGYVLFGLPGGWLADRFRPRAIILLIVLWWSLFTALTGGVKALVGLAYRRPGPGCFLPLMVLIRFLFGLGEAGAYPNIARALGRWFPFRERGAAQGAICSPAGSAGPLRRPSSAASWWWLEAGSARSGFWAQRAYCGRCSSFFGSGIGPGEGLSQPSRMRADPRRSRRAGVHLPGRGSDPGAVGAAVFLVEPALAICGFIHRCFQLVLLRHLPAQILEGAIPGGLLAFGNHDRLAAAGRRTRLPGRRAALRRVDPRDGQQAVGRSLQGAVGLAVAAACALAVSRTDSAWAVILIICIASAFQDLALPAMWSASVDIGGRCAGTVGGCMNSVGAIGAMLSPLVAAKVAILWNWNAVFVVFAVSYFLGALAWLRVDASRPFLTPK